MKFDFFKEIKAAVTAKKISEHLSNILIDFCNAYFETIQTHDEKAQKVFYDFLLQVIDQAEHPFQFSPYHQKIRTPFDYYAFSLEFLRPLVDKSISCVHGKEHLDEITAHLNQNHNVVFLANHQTEADPMAISLLLEDEYPKLAEEMIFVAGERVLTDLCAIPFSMGCNLLCIYSKRYIDHPPELKYEKQMHNKKTMRLMGELLSEGGKCIYVAPSGGRDRRTPDGTLEVAPFDPKSIEMFYFIAKKAKQPTFFYPMALGTYDLLPPPETVQVELGEKRHAKRTGIHLAIGPAIDMELFPGSNNPDKQVRRKCRSEYIWELVKKDYNRFPKDTT